MEPRYKPDSDGNYKWALFFSDNRDFGWQGAIFDWSDFRMNSEETERCKWFKSDILPAWVYVDVITAKERGVDPLQTLAWAERRVLEIHQGLPHGSLTATPRPFPPDWAYKERT